MRIALALCSLTLPLLAQDPDGPAGQPDKPFDDPRAERAKGETAASLFYRAFWIEQAQRESEVAEKLYVDLIERHPDAPEAPRAYVALIRLRVARGEEVDPLVRRLEQRYPKAVAELGKARRLAARLRVEFDPVVREDDTPMLRKIKTIHSDLHMSNGIRSEDEDFLSDLGAAGHPMLAHVLRSTDSASVKRATAVLLDQETDAAYAVIGGALRDPSILYRMTIIDQLRQHAAYPPSLMTTLHDIWPRASRSLRRRIATTWAYAAGSKSPSSDACYGYLVAALRDEDPEVRRAAATLPNALLRTVRPKAYVEAVLPLCRKRDPAVRYVWQWLPWQLAHKDLVSPLIELLGEYEGVLTIARPRQNEERVEEDLAVAMARMSIARYSGTDRARPNHDGTTGFTALAALSSPKAAGMLLDAAMRLGRAQLAWPVRNALSRSEGSADGIDDRIADADKLRAGAIAGSYDDDPQRRQAADAVLSIVGLRASDHALVVREAKAHPNRGILPAAMQQSYLRALGAKRAAELIPAAHASQVSSLLQSGQRVWLEERVRTTLPEPDRSNHGEPFWVAMLERFEPSSTMWNIVFQLPRETGSLAQLVMAWALDAKDNSALNWTVPGKTMVGTKYAERLFRTSHLRTAAASAPLRDRLFRLAADERKEVGVLAQRVARDVKGDAALMAHRTALDSPWDDVVEDGLKRLSEHGEAGAAAIVAYLKRSNVQTNLRKDALLEFSTSAAEQQLPFVRERLDARCGGYEAAIMWGVAFEYEKAPTVERALREVNGDGPPEFRNAALDVLTQCSDLRRLEVFRSILRGGKDADRVHAVLRTVAAQYLIELGPEVLLHLRNPDNGIRMTATKAIERLKFYAEAKKLFDNEK